jgi:PncC family amidohydrolase
MVSATLANIPGISTVLCGSYVTYTVESKEKMLDIPGSTLEKYGAVSKETAAAMVKNALTKSGADIAVSVTGLAGPLGDGSINPVGTVWIGYAEHGKDPIAKKYFFKGNRQHIRKKTVYEALKIAYSNLDV